MAALRAGELQRDFLVQAFFYGGDERLARGDYRLAVANYSRVLRLHPNHPEAITAAATLIIRPGLSPRFGRL